MLRDATDMILSLRNKNQINQSIIGYASRDQSTEESKCYHSRIYTSQVTA